MSELDEILEIVDQDNKVIGKASRGECYQKGLLHRAVNIFIYNSKGEVFLQQRSEKKLKYPNVWDLSCSEHVKPGESFEEAAKRGLKEELGIDTEFEEIIPIHRMKNGTGMYHDNELVVTFKSIYDGGMNFDHNEVADGKFFNPKEINNLISKNELKVTPWFLKDLKILTS